MLPADDAAAAAAAAADSTHVLALAHATLQALHTVLDPPHAAALSARTLLQKAVKAFTSLKRERMRPSALSSQAPRRCHSADKRSSSVAEAIQLQVFACLRMEWCFCFVQIFIVSCFSVCVFYL
jgi:hypothetical protein